MVRAGSLPVPGSPDRGRDCPPKRGDSEGEQPRPAAGSNAARRRRRADVPGTAGPADGGQTVAAAGQPGAAQAVLPRGGGVVGERGGHGEGREGERRRRGGARRHGRLVSEARRVVYFCFIDNFLIGQSD